MPNPIWMMRNILPVVSCRLKAMPLAALLDIGLAASKRQRAVHRAMSHLRGPPCTVDPVWTGDEAESSQRSVAIPRPKTITTTTIILLR